MVKYGADGKYSIFSPAAPANLDFSYTSRFLGSLRLMVFLAGWLLGLMSSRLFGFLVSWLPGLFSWLSGFPASRLPGFLGFCSAMVNLSTPCVAWACTRGLPGPTQYEGRLGIEGLRKQARREKVTVFAWRERLCSFSGHLIIPHHLHSVSNRSPSSFVIFHHRSHFSVNF